MLFTAAGAAAFRLHFQSEAPPCLLGLFRCLKDLSDPFPQVMHKNMFSLSVIARSTICIKKAY